MAIKNAISKFLNGCFQRLHKFYKNIRGYLFLKKDTGEKTKSIEPVTKSTEPVEDVEKELKISDQKEKE